MLRRGTPRKRTAPVRFERGELVVLVESAAMLHELRNFTGDRYRAALNRALGETRVHKLSFQPKR